MRTMFQNQTEHVKDGLPIYACELLANIGLNCFENCATITTLASRLAIALRRCRALILRQADHVGLIY